MSRLEALYLATAEALDGPLEIEAFGRDMLRARAHTARFDGRARLLPEEFHPILTAPDAAPLCGTLLHTPLPWARPDVSDDPLYQAHSLAKVHVELIGPDGLLRSDQVRLGLYGMAAGHEYGRRTHPAEEVFVILAGAVMFARGDDGYQLKSPGARSYHPSMLPHANKTEDRPFLSIYVWRGDVSTAGYDYQGMTGMPAAAQKEGV